MGFGWIERQERALRFCKPPRHPAAAATVVCLCLFISSGCLKVRPSFSPPTGPVSSIEGFASLVVSGEKARTQSRFSFILSLPDRFRVEGTDMLGRTVTLLLFRDEEAFFVVLPRKVYWRGTREEIQKKFLGFSLALPEMAALLSGSWDEQEEQREEKALTPDGWVLVRDERGRVVRGKMREFDFEVSEFHGGGAVPRQVRFSHLQDSGRLKMLSLYFNLPLKESVFEPFFLGRRDFRAVTWEELERMLRDED